MKFFVNFLSAFRIFAAFAIIPTLMFGWYWLTFILFVLGAVSDWFDGYLARKYNVCSKLGGVMDHIGDKLLVVNTMIMLTIVLTLVLPAFIQGFPIWLIIIPVIVMIARELYISGLREFLGTQKIEMPVPKARFSMGKIKTTLQMIALAALLFMMCMPRLAMYPGYEIFASYTFFIMAYAGIIILWLALIASLWSATQYTFTFIEKLKQIKK